MQVTAYYKNILETGDVSLATGIESSLTPLYRLYDRSPTTYFKPTAAVTTTIKVDQSSNPIAISALLIPSGHNLAGMTLDIKWSDNDSDYTAATPQWTGADGNIVKTWDAITHPYWKFIITSPASVPQISELFLSPGYEFERNPYLGSGSFEPVYNVENKMTSGGQDRFLIKGAAKQQRNYTLKGTTQAQRDNFLALYSAWAGANPFWIVDHEGVPIFCKLTSDPNLVETQYGFDFNLNILEVIGT